MKIQEISKVKDCREQVKLNLIEDAQVALNLVLEKNSAKSRSNWVDLDINLPSNDEQTLSVIKTYLLEGIKYCYCSDSHVYKEENGVFSLFSQKTFDSAPNLLTVLVEGERRTLVYSDNASIVRGYGEVEVTLPQSQYSEVCNGVLFLASGNTINFGLPFNFETFSVDLNPTGVIKIEPELGDILALISMETDLQIFCKHGVLSLSTFGQPKDYTLKHYSLPYLDIEPKSIRKIGNRIYFISQNKLCYLKNQTLESADLSLGGNVKVIGDASTYKGYYLLPVNAFGKNVLYVKNTNTDTEWYTHLPMALSQVGGLCVNEKTNKLCTLCFNGENHFESQYESKNMFTGEAEYLQEISFESTANITLKIKTDWQEKTFCCDKGKNKLILGIKTQKFTLGFYCKGGAVEISNLCVTIR